MYMADEQKPASKNPGGRPLKFKSVKKLQTAIDAYFADCAPHAEQTAVLVWNQVEEKYTDSHGKIQTRMIDDRSQPPRQEIEWRITEQRPLTVTDLAVWLGTSRQTLIDYEGRPKFSDTIKGAKDRIEAYWEHRLLGPHATGPIFNLKNNFDWQDKSAVDHTTKDEPIPLLAGLAPAKLVVEDDANAAPADDRPSQD